MSSQNIGLKIEVRDRSNDAKHSLGKSLGFVKSAVLGKRIIFLPFPAGAASKRII